MDTMYKDDGHIPADLMVPDGAKSSRFDFRIARAPEAVARAKRVNTFLGRGGAAFAGYRAGVVPALGVRYEPVPGWDLALFVVDEEATKRSGLTSLEVGWTVYGFIAGIQDEVWRLKMEKIEQIGKPRRRARRAGGEAR